MAFCVQCGTNVGGANFCPNCGTPVAGIAAEQPVPVQQPEPVLDIRQQTIKETIRMKDYFLQKKSVYDAYIKTNKEVKALAEEDIVKLLIASAISLAIGIFSKSLFFCLLAVPTTVAFFVKSKKNKKNMIDASARLADLGEELDRHYKGYGDCPVGINYTYPDLLVKLCGYVEDGEAETFSKAIDCYKKEVHRQTMEEEAKKTRKLAEKAAKEAAFAADMAALNALID